MDRDLRIRIDAVLAATIFSLLAAIAAIVLVVSANDESATKDQVHALRNDVEGVQHKAAAAQKDVNATSTRLDTVEGDVSTLFRKADHESGQAVGRSGRHQGPASADRKAEGRRGPRERRQPKIGSVRERR